MIAIELLRVESESIFDQTSWEKVVDYFGSRAAFFKIDGEAEQTPFITPYLSGKLPYFGRFQFYGVITPEFLKFIKKQFDAEGEKLMWSIITFFNLPQDIFTQYMAVLNSDTATIAQKFESDHQIGASEKTLMCTTNYGGENYLYLENLTEYHTFLSIFKDYPDFSNSEIVEMNGRWFSTYDNKSIELYDKKPIHSAEIPPKFLQLLERWEMYEANKPKDYRKPTSSGIPYEFLEMLNLVPKLLKNELQSRFQSHADDTSENDS